MNAPIINPYAKLGPVTSGTDHMPDLIAELADELKYLDVAGNYQQVVQAAADHLAEPIVLADDEKDMLNQLVWALEDFAPPYCGFWSNDTGAWGFGVDWDLVADGVYEGDIIKSEDPPANSDDENRGWSYWLQVNDHGNATLYQGSEKTGWTELWGVV